jgi:hypothetical protein
MTATRNENKTAPTATDEEAAPVRDNTVARLTAVQAASDHAAMKVIPWRDIWIALNLAKRRGNVPMVNAFYDMLFRDAVFDDRGAWSLNIPRPK